jgi:hypothetical protein
VAGKESPLRRLAELGEEERRIEKRLKALKVERDKLIRKAAQQGKTEGQIANAVGRSPGLVNHIKHRR